jgi:hypothetical protein
MAAAVCPVIDLAESFEEYLTLSDREALRQAFGVRGWPGASHSILSCSTYVDSDVDSVLDSDLDSDVDGIESLTSLMEAITQAPAAVADPPADEGAGIILGSGAGNDRGGCPRGATTLPSGWINQIEMRVDREIARALREPPQVYTVAQEDKSPEDQVNDPSFWGVESMAELGTPPPRESTPSSDSPAVSSCESSGYEGYAFVLYGWQRVAAAYTNQLRANALRELPAYAGVSSSASTLEHASIPSTAVGAPSSTMLCSYLGNHDANTVGAPSSTMCSYLGNHDANTVGAPSSTMFEIWGNHDANTKKQQVFGWRKKEVFAWRKKPSIQFQ